MPLCFIVHVHLNKAAHKTVSSAIIVCYFSLDVIQYSYYHNKLGGHTSSTVYSIH